ncbi:hypothetical protein HZC07_03425 [Candidatus Micrarchaeota archaeon]|nr:hypothetical protein [Candidatus Micrarchaeota archaeon]
MEEECTSGKCESSCGGDAYECESNCGCESDCDSECGCPSPDELAMVVGKMAMYEALKDRVKKRMEAKMGPKLDKIADLIVEGFAGHMQEHQSMCKKQEWMNK